MASGLIFTADDGVSGRELWISDGSEAGTRLLRDIAPGSASSDAQILQTLRNGRVIFTADDGTNGVELWVTNGTTAGTRLIRDTSPGASDARFFDSVLLSDGRAAFSTKTQVGSFPYYQTDVWVTDGTASGTERLLILPLSDDSGGRIDNLVQLEDGRLAFEFSDANAYYGFSDVYALELSSGDPDRLNSNVFLGGSQLEFFSDNTLLFTEVEGTYASGIPGPSRLSLIDGNSNTDTLLAEAEKIFTDLTVKLGDGRVLFTTLGNFEGDPDPSTDEYQLWITDGTRSGTDLVKQDFAAFGFSAALGDGRVLFKERNFEADRETLWVSDGTTSGTFAISQDFAVSQTEFANLEGGVALFTPESLVSGRELWNTNGTTLGTFRVKDIRPGIESSNPGGFTPLGDGRFVFAADDGVHGRELWITDGRTESGTRLIEDIGFSGFNSSGSSDPINLTALGDGRVMFSAYGNFLLGRELWITDGESIELVSDVGDVAYGFSGNPADFVVFDLPNSAPTVAAPLLNRTGTEVEPFSFRVPEATFADRDYGDELTLSARLASGGKLPSWLRFNAITETFSGVPGNRDAGTLTVRVTATDENGAIAFDDFILTITDNGTGTAASENFAGSAGNDVLFAAGGDDFVRGENGSDRLFAEAGADTLDGGNGNDSLDGGIGDDILRGSNGRDTLLGGAGRDTLAGGAGADVLSGGADADIYRFAIPGDGVDTIQGFVTAEEIQFAAAGFGNLPLGAIAASRFEADADAVASKANVRFVYQTTTGRLFYDPDGSGGAGSTQVAVLEGAPTLNAADIVIL